MWRFALRSLAAVPVLLVALLLPSPCIAQTEEEPAAEPYKDVTYIALSAWLPREDELWSGGFGVRFCDIRRSNYVTGVVGAGRPEADLIKVSREGEPMGSVPFMGIGAGTKLAQSSDGHSFLGLGLTFYMAATGERMEGYVWVNEYGTVLGPAYEDRFFFAPEVVAHLTLGSRLGVEASACLASRGQPPSEGLFVGLTYRKDI